MVNRSYYRKPARWGLRLKSTWIKRAAVVGFAAVIVGMLVFLGLFVYFGKDLPSPDKVVRRDGFATKIFDRNGQLLYDVFSDQRRTPVDIVEVPQVLKQATVAIEDKDFYKHRGFDPLTPLRIVYNFVFRGGRVVGGSTLTQQLVKNTLLSDERTVTRKIKEFILTLQVERKYSKDQILQMYLNEVPYGSTAYGVQAAAELFFNKPVRELNLVEAAVIAGLPQSPSRYSPISGTGYIERTKEVLRRMREDGYITREEEKKAIDDLANLQTASSSGILKAPHFVFYVRQALINRYGERVVEQGGLRVTTTLDLNLQEAAQKAVAEEIDKVKHLKISNGSAVVLDPKNGQILAMVGSKDWNDPNSDGKFNVAVQGLRQPGSSIKPLVYLTGLREGYTAASMFMDTKTSFPGGDKPEYLPVNYDGKYRGPVLMREALGNSLNIPAVKMIAKVGVADVLKLGYDMGIKTYEPTPQLLSRVGLSLALGGGEVHLLDMAAAYSAFANGGKRVDPVSILKVTDSKGKVLEEWKDIQAKQVVSAEEAFIMSSMLSDPAARTITFGPGTSLSIPGKTVAVKTGTTNDKRDNWTVGWTPSSLVGVWVGNNDNSPMREVASGITGASPIWNRIFKEVLRDKSREEFATPSGIVAMDVDRVSGYAAHDNLPAKKEYFVSGTQPVGEDPIHKMIKVCKGEGKLATPADIAGNNYDLREALYFKEEDPYQGQKDWPENQWQKGILAWLSEQKDPKYAPPTEFCGSTNPVWITVLEPADRSRINSNDVKVRLDIADVSKITEVKVFLDGTEKYKLTSEPWEITIPNVSNGKHRIDIEARNEKGQVGSRYVEIAVNQDF